MCVSPFVSHFKLFYLFFTGILICIIGLLLCFSYGLMIFYQRRNYTMQSSYGQMA